VRRQLTASLPLGNMANRVTPATPRSRFLTTVDFMCMMRNPRSKAADVTSHLERMRQFKEPGWLRLEEARVCGRDTPNLDSHLSEIERRLVFELHILIRPDELKEGVGCQASTCLLSHAWGVCDRTIRNVDQKALEKHGETNPKRKERSDKGSNIFTCQKKQKANFTGMAAFKKLAARERRHEPLLALELKQQWNSMSPKSKEPHHRIAEHQIQRGPHLVNDVKDALLMTKGSITWHQLEAQLAGGENQVSVASREAIRRCVMGLPNSSHSKTTMFPHLTESAKKRRHDWSKGFWTFWNSAALFGGKVQIVLVHMDEKWFCAIVVRRSGKCVPHLGVSPLQVNVHHKSHICKMMVMCSEHFAPFDNDVAKGGLAGKVNATRVGHMVKAKKDSCRRVHHDDGSFSHPKVPENLLRKKDEEHFKPLEICGSTLARDGKPKFSLLDWFLETELP